MISKELYKEIMKKWLTIGEVYQEPRRVLYRLEHFSEHCLPLLKGRKVLEIGCNAGICGYHICEVADSYIGLEPGNKVRDPKKKSPPKTDFFKQAMITHTYIKNKNAVFLNATISEFCKTIGNFDTMVACFAIYHFRDFEIELLKKHVFPKCDLIIIQNREQRRPKIHNSYHFDKTKNLVKFFKGLGYEVEVIWGKHETKGKVFSEVICKK